jgi:hypothetical protein
MTNSDEPQLLTFIHNQKTFRGLSTPITAHTCNGSDACMTVHSARQQIATAAKGEVKLWQMKIGV